MDLSIIIVSWNVCEKLKKNLESIFASSGEFSFEVFVADNNSRDNTVQMVRENFPQVNLIENQDNLGFAKANNQAIKKVSGDFVLLLNPDMLLRGDTLINMISWMRANKQASVAGCKLIDEQGRLLKHVRRFPRLSDQLAIVLKLPHIFPGILKDYIRKDFDYSYDAKVDSVRGGFFMIRRETLEKLKGLDERYFIWFEEVDFCRQVYASGEEVWYTNSAACVDYVGASFKKEKINIKQKYFRDSMLKYFKKWHPFWQYLILRFAWMIIFLPTRFLAIFNYNPPKAKT